MRQIILILLIVLFVSADAAALELYGKTIPEVDGTPTVGQIAEWVDAATIKGVAQSTYSLSGFTDDLTYVDQADVILIAQVIIENLTAAMDNYGIFTADTGYTITSVGVRCEGTCTLAATITLEDGAANAMTITGTNPTVQTSDSGAVVFSAVTAGGAIAEGELVRMSVTNAVDPETDKYFILLRGTRTY